MYDHLPTQKKHPFRTPIDSTLVERLNNTVRKRNKVQRGWKKDNTPLRNGQMIYYNFVRPHMTLEGKTPAEVARIGVQGRNKWMELLKHAINGTQ